MSNNELPEIEFEGKPVKPKRGIYKCPFRCSADSSYPERTWKTERGFRKHMEECSKRPSLLKRQQENKELELSAFETIKAEILSDFPIKKGDIIPVIREIIVKPTHVQRFNRMVRVRYEAEKRFEAIEIEVKNIHINRTTITDKNYIRNNCLFINDEYRLSSVCTSLPAAKDRAIQMQKSYNEACEFASQCR